jgi:hypothetical protein
MNPTLQKVFSDKVLIIKHNLLDFLILLCFLAEERANSFGPSFWPKGKVDVTYKTTRVYICA